MASAPTNDHLVWTRTTVRGRTAMYGVAGDGIPLLFLHGWGLGQHTYKRTLKRLVQLGCRVFAPLSPGWGAPPTSRAATAPSPGTRPGPTIFWPQSASPSPCS